RVQRAAILARRQPSVGGTLSRHLPHHGWDDGNRLPYRAGTRRRPELTSWSVALNSNFNVGAARAVGCPSSLRHGKLRGNLDAQEPREDVRTVAFSPEGALKLYFGTTTRATDTSDHAD